MAIISIGIVSANQDNNTHDNIVLQPLEETNHSLQTWTTHSWLEVNFHNQRFNLINGSTMRIQGHVEYPLCSMQLDPIEVYIDGKYVDTTYMSGPHPIDGVYSDYTFHDLTPGYHTLLLKYNGYKHESYLPDIEPCTYSCNILVFDRHYVIESEDYVTSNCKNIWYGVSVEDNYDRHRLLNTL